MWMRKGVYSGFSRPSIWGIAISNGGFACGVSVHSCDGSNFAGVALLIKGWNRGVRVVCSLVGHFGSIVGMGIAAQVSASEECTVFLCPVVVRWRRVRLVVSSRERGG